MSSEFKDTEPSVVSEEVERRGDVRGILRGFRMTMPDGVVMPVREGSRKGFFVDTEDPDRFRLGEVLGVKLVHDDVEVPCRVEVVRKEIQPRRGLVLRIVYITPVAEEQLKVLLDEV